MGQKSTIKRFSLLMFASAVLLNCAQGNCRRKDAEIPAYPGQKEIIEGRGRPVLSDEEKAKRVFVYKYDGSLQCSLGKAVKVEEMAKELSGIQLLSQVNKSDGLMRIQVCGATAGTANVFEIYRKDLSEAQKRGFKVWDHN